MFSVYKRTRDHSETPYDLVRFSFSLLRSTSELSVTFLFSKCYRCVILFHLSRVDLAHLVLYHLSLCCKRKYFDFDHEIMAFTNENWESLLLGMVMRLACRISTHRSLHYSVWTFYHLLHSNTFELILIDVPQTRHGVSFWLAQEWPTGGKIPEHSSVSLLPGFRLILLSVLL